ncbi:MAG: homoserine dehydrogenase [Erysipelotrichaceae bacterium]
MNIALCGYGVVGRGVATLMNNHPDLHVTHILTRTNNEAPFTTSFTTILESKPDVIIECMGGEQPATSYLRLALASGIACITSNKEVVSKHLDSFLDLAKQHQTSFRFEASCGGGVLWLDNLARIANYDEIVSLHGILNGTSNFILSSMQKGASFDSALASAQAQGFAEADPSADLDGLDLMRKNHISSSIAYRCFLPQTCPCFSMRHITKEDLTFFDSLKLRVKYMAHSYRQMDGIQNFVCLTLCDPSEVYANVENNQNYAWAHTLGAQQLGFYGLGAGSLPTASAILHDIFQLDTPQKISLNQELLEPSSSWSGNFLLRSEQAIDLPNISEHWYLAEHVSIAQVEALASATTVVVFDEKAKVTR